MSDAKNVIAKRIAKEFKAGDVINLGAGLPTLVTAYIPTSLNVMIHTENGIVGERALPAAQEPNPRCVNAGNVFCEIVDAGSYVSSSHSFGIIRGGHLDYTVLGTMQVDQEGSMANYMVTGGRIVGMGGAMDLVAGAKKVYVATEHCAKDGSSKILRRCSYPLTGRRVVSKIFTELCVLEVAPEGLILRELAEGVSPEEVRRKTEADVIMGLNQRRV